MNDSNLNGVGNNTNNLGNNVSNGNQNLETFDMPNNQNNSVDGNNVYNSTSMNTGSASSVENRVNNGYVSNTNSMNSNMMNMNNGMNTVPNNNQNVSEVSNTNFTNNTVNNNFPDNLDVMNTNTMNMNSGINTMNSNLSNDMNNFTSPNMNSTVSSDNNDSFNTKSNKGLIIGIIVLIVLIIGGVVGFIVFKELNTPKTRFLKTMNKYLESNNIDSNVIDIYELFKDGATLNVDGNLSVKSNDEELLSGKININFVDNPSSSNRYINIKFDDNKDSILNFESYLNDNKVYFTMKDIFDKYYFTGLEYIKIYDENVKKLKDNVSKSLDSYFTNDKFILSKEEGYSKISVSLSDKDLNNLLILILGNLKNDDALSLFVNEDMSLEDIGKELDDEINSIKENLEYQSDEKIYTYNVYSKGSTLVKQEIIVDDIKLVIEGETSGNITLLSDDTVILTGSYDKDKLNLNVSDNDINFDFSLTFNNNITKDNVAANYNLVIKTKSEEDELVVNADLELGITKDNTIPKVDISNATDISDITNEEIQNIYTKLGEVPMLSLYFSMFSGLGDSDYSYDDDYSYDYSTDADLDSDYEYDNCSPGMNCQSSIIKDNTIDDSGFGI